MQLRIEFIFVLLFLLFCTIVAVSAGDSNSTLASPTEDNNTLNVEGIVDETNGTGENLNNTVNQTDKKEKTTPDITIGSTSVKSRDSLEIYLKNSTGSPINSKLLHIYLNDKEYSLSTDSEGIATLGINLGAGSYTLKISFDGDYDYNSISKSFKISVSKLKTKFVESANFVVKGKYLYFYLIDGNGNPVSGKKVTFKFNGKTYTKKTNSRGRVKLKIKSSNKKYYSVKLKFRGDSQFKSSSKKLKFYVIKKSRSIKIGNSKLLTNGYLRVYLKINGKSVSKKVTLIIAGKKLKKKSNSEGIAIFKPGVKAYYYVVKAKVGKYYSAKNIKCYEGNVKDPLSENVSYNGRPDIDVMPGNYVMGDNNAKYTLTKSQYKEVLKRDSYCLFLNSKLTKYTFFKTKNHPKLNHIIKREKWNVIERAINTKLVKKNKLGYWPGKITVSLKGKSYTYPEVRDVQNTGYTCGPTSGSVCSQVLKNYVCEKYLSKLAGTKRGAGTPCEGIKRALEKNHFDCAYYYKASFNDALDILKNGGAALVFHANRHYVAILDISNDGKKVLVSNSYGSYDNIPTKWLKVSYMKTKFSHWEESLIVRLNYKLSDATKNSVNCYYNSFGTKWLKHNTHQTIGRI